MSDVFTFRKKSMEIIILGITETQKELDTKF